MTIQSIIKRVQAYYPGAVVSMSVSGKYFIEHDDQNLNDIFNIDDEIKKVSIIKITQK